MAYKKGPTSATAGAAISPSVTVQVEDKFGNLVTTDKSNVTLAIASGPSHSAPKKIGNKVSDVPVAGTLSGTTTQTAVNGVATFSDLSLNFAGSYTLTASDAKLTAATSSSFAIAAGSASQVVFSTQPAGAVAGRHAGRQLSRKSRMPPATWSPTDTSKITLAIASGPEGASLGGTLKISAVAGVASFSDLVLQTAGAYTLSATDSALTAATSSSFTITPAAASQLVGKQAPTTFIAGSAITPAATMAVEDQFGNVVTTDKSKVTAAIATGTGPTGAVLSGTSTAAAVAGIVTFSNLVLDTAGSYRLSFADGSLTGLETSSFTVVAGAAAKIAFGQVPTTAAAGAKISPAVTVDVEDKFGNTVSTDSSIVTLTIASAPTGVPLGSLAAFHASSGVATFSNLGLFSVAGNYTIKAADAKFTAVTSAPFAITPAAAAKLVFLQGPTNETAGAKFTPTVTVQVQDAYGNVITGDTSNVTMAIADGTNPAAVTLGGTLTQAAAKGVATFGDLAINTAGRYRLSATDGSLTAVLSSPFNVTAGAAAELAFAQGPTATVAGSTISPNVTVDVEDKFGNLVTTDKSKVTVAIAGPTGAKMLGTLTQTAVNGVATFTDLAPQTAGASTLSASDAKLTAPTPAAFTVSPGTAAKLVFGTAPAATDVAGVTFSSVTVQVEDALGNVVTGDTSKVTLALASGTGTLAGTLKPSAIAGVATFSDLAIQTAGAYTISATDGSLTNVTSGTVTITPAAASQVAIGQAPTGATAGAAISPTMTAQVEDQFGNVVTTDTSKITVAISTGPTGAAITGTAQVTAVKGLGTFTGISLKTAGSYKLSFSDASLTAPTSSSFTISAAAAAKLAFGVAPSAAAKTVAISPQSPWTWKINSATS